MKNDAYVKQTVRTYLRSLPDILNYQIATKALIAIWVFLLGRIFQALLKSSGRVAVTSGDWKFLFNTWQGLFILLLGLVSLFLYVAFDLDSKIVLCREVLSGEKVSFTKCINEGFFSVGKLINLQGIIVIIYIALIAPILGIGISISLTEGLYIPTFISSFIESSALYSALAGFAVLLFLSIGIANLFILQGIIIDKLPIKDARKQSRSLVKENWKDYIIKNIRYILVIGVSLAVIAVICLFLPLKLITTLSMPSALRRPLTIFFVLAGLIISVLADLFATPLYLLEMTRLYYSYKQGKDDSLH